MPKLTAKGVQALSRPGMFGDGQGLYLNIAAAGSKSWILRVTIGGKRREVGLGSLATVSLAEARAKAQQLRAEAKAGRDPTAARDHRQVTFAEVAENYLAAKLGEFRNEKHRKQWRSTIETYANPMLGRKAIADIDVLDLLRVLEPIWHEKTETASRLRGRIENILSWATVKGYRKGDNPARWRGNLSEILPKQSKVAKVENQPALALSDAARWRAALAGREGMAARALEFLALTTARSGEVRGAVWDEIDTENAVWTIPASKMKNRREHRVPLTEEAIALLDALPRFAGSNYVFVAPRGGMLSDMSLSAVMRRMQEAEVKAGRAGYLDPRSKRPAVPHGLRSTFRQWAAELGYPRDMAEIALAHFIGSEVERAYQRSDMLERRRAMMAAWADFLGGRQSAEIVEFPVRA